MHPSHKRKHRSRTTATTDRLSPLHEAPRALYIQAYEADINRGADAKQAAAALETRNYISGDPPRTGLIRWGDEGAPGPGAEAVWVDRYDARLLLDALPPHSPSHPRSQLQSQSRSQQPGSPGGWEDLPSDTEDMFFLGPEEVGEMRREKRRRMLEQQREDRVRARRIEDGEPAEDEDENEHEDMWGGSDEEPSAEQRELMERTARHILGSQNPAGLELRILANYGGDARFAFIRGRWARAWALIRAREGVELEKEREKSGKVQGGLGGLAEYEDSEEEDGGGAKGEDEEVDNAMERRRIKAKEWAANRRKLRRRESKSSDYS